MGEACHVLGATAEKTIEYPGSGIAGEKKKEMYCIVFHIMLSSKKRDLRNQFRRIEFWHLILFQFHSDYRVNSLTV